MELSHLPQPAHIVGNVLLQNTLQPQGNGFPKGADGVGPCVALALGPNSLDRVELAVKLGDENACVTGIAQKSVDTAFLILEVVMVS